MISYGFTISKILKKKCRVSAILYFPPLVTIILYSALFLLKKFRWEDLSRKLNASDSHLQEKGKSFHKGRLSEKRGS